MNTEMSIGTVIAIIGVMALLCAIGQAIGLWLFFKWVDYDQARRRRSRW